MGRLNSFVNKDMKDCGNATLLGARENSMFCFLVDCLQSSLIVLRVVVRLRKDNSSFRLYL